MTDHSFSSPPGLTVTGAPEGTGPLADSTSSNAAPGLPGHAGPQVSDRISVPGKVGVTRWDQVRNPAGRQPAGIPVSAWTRTAVTYPGFR